MDIILELAITLVFMGLVCWWALAQSAKQNQAMQGRRKKCQRLLGKAFPDIDEWHEVWWGNNDSNFTLMRMDDTEGDIYFVYHSNSRIEKYSKKYILSSEVIEDGKSIASAKRMSQIAWGMAGGLVAGAPGAVIGGLGTAHKTKDYVNSVVLRVGLIDPNRPVREIPFLTARVKSGSALHVTGHNNALEWHNRFQSSIRKADWESEKTTAAIDQPQNPEVRTIPEKESTTRKGDTLSRLADLYREGLLTREEFEIEKKRIINSK